MVFIKYRRNRTFADKVFQKGMRYNTIGRKLYRNYAPAIGTAYAAYRMAKRIKRTLNPEQKFLDKNFSDNTIPASVTGLVLTDMGQGITANTRNGISIRSASLFINFKIFRSINSTRLYDNIRVIIFIDTNQDENAAYPSTSDVLTNTTNTTVINSPLNTRKAGRFTILYDKVFSLTELRPIVNMKVFKRVGHHVRFQGSGTAPTDLRQGHIYIMYMSDATENSPGQLTQTRYRFYDN